ncbi:hypothetical protein OG2516_16324 [Oceanicola granulosus HTCC2516]|uniref:DnaA N-terminal domain-containing protein n=1 Tax=Oceanicola granulosus (strain ATCC BAA-861 / DSM 15982 / KCTC 12143 / HTCC2516) TaxID=314256 RepID=Q2CGQ1_OCEGH|nr:hypothetical protein OG2516_16324 [Oceanicola granulosus HTCC2516]
MGREAASRKYDILSALMAFALSGDKSRQRLILRLTSLITTRYNWQRDELSMGQAEIARLWCVDERTVKREMARLRGLGWLVLKRQGARGRVSVHGLDLERILIDTRPVWANIGTDFVDRLAPGETAPEAGNVVPFRAPEPGAGGAAAGTWGAAQAVLHREDAATYGAWFHLLTEVGRDGGRLTLLAPSSFHASYVATHLQSRLLAGVRVADPSVSHVEVTS